MSREDHAKYFFLSEWTLANSGFLKMLRKISPKFALTFKTLASRKSQEFLSNFCGLCGLSAKDQGTTENPVSDLEPNLSKTATKAIKFY